MAPTHNKAQKPKSTIHPCQQFGVPHPYPYVFAGNQKSCFRELIVGDLVQVIPNLWELGGGCESGKTGERLFRRFVDSIGFGLMTSSSRLSGLACGVQDGVIAFSFPQEQIAPKQEIGRRHQPPRLSHPLIVQ